MKKLAYITKKDLKKKFVPDEIPKCYDCGKNMTEVIDSIAKRKTGHLWHCEKCYPNRILSIG